MRRRILRQRLLHPLLMLAMLIALLGLLVVPAQAQTQTPPDADTYTNPLKPQVQVTPQIPNGGIVESCADPTIFRAPDTFWYIYCTKDPLNDQDRTDGGEFIFRNMPILKSADLVNWTYEGDVFTDANYPSWVERTAGLFAPEIQYSNGTYYLYYTITDTKPEISGAPNCNGDSAIGVATSTSPTGPWVSVDVPVVEPRYNGDSALAFGSRQCNFFWTYDPEVYADEAGQKYMFYGSYYGGIFARELSADYLTTDPATAVQITVGNRYEGPEIVEYEGYYYMFVSAANCCNTALTGYSVFAGRSTSLLGPYVDREGVSLMAGRVGGTPVLSMNGNRWVGPGHNSVFQDFEGQYWTVYHAVDRFDPNYEGALGFTKRPVLLDPVDWIGGWPTVRGGRWASDEPMPAPAAQPGDESGYTQKVVRPDVSGRLIPELSDEFNETTLSSQWSWVRQPAAATYGVSNGTLRFDTQNADLFVDNNSASVLTRDTPAGNYMVETKVTLNVPAEGCCFNYVQAGLVIYGTDDAFIKLVHASIWETRQTEFAKEVPTEVAAGGARYGNTVVGPPNLTTWLRIVKRVQLNGEETYTAYTSRDGRTYVRGGTWTHKLGANAKIGLVSMGGSGFTANFDYVRVYKVQDRIFMPTMVQQNAVAN
jgi:arabinan endo-1,5-alpha-L-arabinosidase